MIDPSIWTSEKFVGLSRAARLLFIGIFSLADDYGRIKAAPLWLKLNVFPADADTIEEIGAYLLEICDSGLALPYTHEGRAYLVLPGWTETQKRFKRFDPKHPAPPRSMDLGDTFYVRGEIEASPGSEPSPPQVATNGHPGAVQVQKKLKEEKLKEEAVLPTVVQPSREVQQGTEIDTSSSLYRRAEKLRDQIIVEVARPLPVSEAVTRKLYDHLANLPDGKSVMDLLDEIGRNVEEIRKKPRWDYLLGTSSAMGVVGNLIERWHGEAEKTQEERKRTAREDPPEYQAKRAAARNLAQQLTRKYAISPDGGNRQ
mgnify:CR=1 FL=1